jgi:hypothetical protein
MAVYTDPYRGLKIDVMGLIHIHQGPRVVYNPLFRVLVLTKHINVCTHCRFCPYYCGQFIHILKWNQDSKLRSVCVGFVVHKVALGQAFLQVLRFSSVIHSSSVPYLFITDAMRTLKRDSAIKQHVKNKLKFYCAIEQAIHFSFSIINCNPLMFRFVISCRSFLSTAAFSI